MSAVRGFVITGQERFLGPWQEARRAFPDEAASLERLAALKPAFREGGSLTAGNSSGINDGAAALVVASEEKA